jgi:hypothetical protein
MNEPILFGGPGSPREVELTNQAKDAVKAALLPLLDTHCAVALLNALVTIYVEMGLAAVGVEVMNDSIQTLHRELPRIAAVLRSSFDEPAGRA